VSGALTFGVPIFLWGVLAAPLVLAAAVFVYLRRRSRLEYLASSQALERLAASASPLRFFLRAIALAGAVLFLVLAAAQPKLGLKPVPVQRRGVDLIIALDVSKSMDATDVSPSRLQRALHGIDTLLAKLGGDRIGLVAFAGRAVLVHPLTTRAAGFGITLRTLDTDVLPLPGTALAAAIEETLKGFESASARHKVLVMITDGETHDEGALDQARRARDEGVIIYTLGIGTESGSLVPETYDDGKPVRFRKEEGRYVISRLNTELLTRIAEIGGGKYYPFGTTGDVLDSLYEQISKLGEEEMAQRFKAMLNDIYQYPLFAALILLGLEMAIGQRRRNGGKP